MFIIWVNTNLTYHEDRRAKPGNPQTTLLREALENTADLLPHKFKSSKGYSDIPVLCQLC
jgi:hypothetical protein